MTIDHGELKSLILYEDGRCRNRTSNRPMPLMASKRLAPTVAN